MHFLDPTALPRTPAGYLEAWVTINQAWVETIASAESLPAELMTARVDGQWSVSENLRHLVFATDSWVRRTILGIEAPYWPAGVPHDEAAVEDGIDVTTWGIDPTLHPAFDDVVSTHRQRLEQVRTVIESVTAQGLLGTCAANSAPGNPGNTEVQVGRCLDVWVSEEWGHHNYVMRDLSRLSGLA